MNEILRYACQSPPLTMVGLKRIRRKEREVKGKNEEDRGKEWIVYKTSTPSIIIITSWDWVREREDERWFLRDVKSPTLFRARRESLAYRLENEKRKLKTFHLRSSSSCSSSLRHVVCASCYESIMIFPSATTKRCSTIFFSCFKCFSLRGRKTQHNKMSGRRENSGKM